MVLCSHHIVNGHLPLGAVGLKRWAMVNTWYTSMSDDYKHTITHLACMYCTHERIIQPLLCKITRIPVKLSGLN